MTLSEVEGSVEDTERSRSMVHIWSIERNIRLVNISAVVIWQKSHFFLWEAGGFFYIAAL